MNGGKEDCRRYIVQSTKYHVLSTKYQVPGAMYKDIALRSLRSTIWVRKRIHTWYFVLRTWYMVQQKSPSNRIEGLQ